MAQGWTPNGDILFRSGRDGVPTRLWQFYTVSPAGGLPTPLALPQAYLGGMSADGAYLAYQEIGYWDPEWRNYRGGQAQPVGIVSTSTWERTTPSWEGERQMDPAWMDGVVYYMSERDWASNVWSFDPRSGAERQLTRHADFDVKSLGAGDGVVVYEQAGYLHELDPGTGSSRQLVINVAGDMNWSRARWEAVSAGQLRDARLSPTGKRALFEWRGELFSVPARRLDNQLRAIFVHDTESGETRQLTDGMSDAITPVWDESGKYLYFLASTDFGLNTGWLDMTSYDRPVTRALYLALLSSDEPSPFLPRSDEEETDDEGGDDEEGGDEGEGRAGADDSGRGGRGAPGSDDSPTVTIDFEGIAGRIIDAPGLSTADYAGLVPGPSGTVFVLAGSGFGGGSVLKYSVEDREAEDFLESGGRLAVSHDRSRLLYYSGGWRIVSTARPPSGGDGALDLGTLRVRVEPKAEYAQMLRDGWRFMRDFLYVDNQHGAPWDDVWDWYSAWLPDVRHRSDFNHLLDMLSGEIAVGHSYVSGGDYPDLDNPRTGLLGTDLREENGFYRITRIYNGGDWTPGLAGPLSHPGMDVHEGDYLLAVDGAELRAPTNPYRLLEGTAGRAITLTVASSTSPEDARDIVVEPTGNEGALRRWAWVEANQARVDEMSGGRLAHVWLPNTGQGGYQYFNRMYYAQQDREGAVIDERNNGGGSAADYIVDMLDRELTGYFNSRAGDRKPWTQPMAGLFGPKVMVINERAGSGGDLLPYLFRFREIGPLVGTWDTPPLIDGGGFVAPRGGFFDVNGEWAVEAEGVAPDIEVRNDPAPVIAGGDPQLAAAVREALRLLETGKVTFQDEPPPPVRWRRPGGGR